MNKYLLNLFKQFNDSLGIKTLNFDSKEYIEAFSNWIYLMSEYSKIYQDYIQYLGVDLDSSLTIELNKGKYDSIGLSNTTIISPYAETLGKENSELCVFQGELVILTGSKIKRGQVAETYITQNIYTLQELEIFKYFVLNDINMCLGVYGSIYDKDKNSKIQELIEFKQSLNFDTEEYSDVENDIYMYVLRNSNPKKLEKILTR